MEKGKREFGHFFSHQKIISAATRAEFDTDKMFYIILRGCWCDIIVLNVHAPTEHKTDDVKDSFYAQLEHVFDRAALRREQLERNNGEN
jgi:hypothetical protein